MVFYVRTRVGWNDLLRIVEASASPIWIDKDVLTSDEAAEWRAKGLNLTNFTVEAVDEPDLSTVRMHHPNDVIWVESK
jgi:hypothetical protein